MPPLPDQVRRPARAIRLAVLRRRRPLAAVCAAVAVVAAISAVTDGAPETVPVTVAARDLPAGSRIDDSDLTTLGFRMGTDPSDAVAAPVGRVLATSVGGGEPITEQRLLGPALAADHPGLTAVPLRLPDPGMVALLRVGDAVDLVATDPERSGARVVASGVPVLALPSPDVVEAGGGSLPGRLVVVGLLDEAVAEVSAAAVASFLSFTWSGHESSR